MFLGVTFWAENQTPAYDLGLIGMVLAASGVIAWGGFALIRSWLVFEVNTMDGRHHKGLWLTDSAKDKLRGIGLPKGARKPPSAIELLCGNGNNLDAVWSANARRAAGAVLTLALFFRSSIVMAGVALFAVSLGPSSPAIKVISDTELELSAVALFSHDSSVLSEYGKKQLAQYLPQIVAQASTNIHVVGHTDTTGNKSYNLTLSLQRAQAVQAWMEARPELENVAIEAFGKGESEPLFDEETVGLLQRNEAQLGNRRVDILLDPMDEQSGK
ncbi:OmpA family protein [Ruegeria litorea]|nr:MULTISPECIES: OmpA family protein [Roseobacteraceae]MBT3142286.1 OmpA family protein [Falsiruegeria litorea]